MKPQTINGKKYFPTEQRHLSMLKPGEHFKTIHGSTLYTKTDTGVKDAEGKDAFYPDKMPVIPMKTF